MLEKTEGIVLNSIKYGDSSKIIQVFTKNFGKLSFIAKGAFNTKSKFGASLEPTTYANFTFYNKPNKDLYLLSNSELIQSFSNLSKFQENLIYAMMILECIYLTQEPKVKNEKLFDHLLFSLLNISDTSISPFNIFCYFMFLLSSNMGFAITLNKDLLPDSDYYIDFQDGNIKMWDNLTLKNIFKFDYNELKSLYSIILENDFNKQYNKNFIDRIYNFWMQYFSFHLERKFFLKTYTVLC